MDVLYNSTETYIRSLEGTYLDKYLADKTTTPVDYDLDVKSYCILCHAAFEEFAETLTVKVMEQTIENFVMHRRLTSPLIYLMHFKSSGEKFLDNDESEDKINLINCYDYTRQRLGEIKSRFSKEIFNNHGVSLKYIRQLFMPIGIDIPNDPVMLNSLKQLSKERGAYAHKFLDKGSVRRSIEPEKAKTIVDDCLRLCFDIKERAKALL